jgi:hypothetical protein
MDANKILDQIQGRMYECMLCGEKAYDSVDALLLGHATRSGNVLHVKCYAEKFSMYDATLVVSQFGNAVAKAQNAKK